MNGKGVRKWSKSEDLPEWIVIKLSWTKAENNTFQIFLFTVSLSWELFGVFLKEILVHKG